MNNTINKYLLNYIKIYFILVIGIFIYSCTGSPSYKISDYNKKAESFNVEFGQLKYDTLSNNLNTHSVIEGGNYAVTYKRSGTTFIDVNDYEARYYEYLIFEIDSSVNEFAYCDTNLSEINCKYYWICYAKSLKKEVFDVKKGCIIGEIKEDTLQLKLDIEVNFGFGGILEKDKNRKINRKETILFSELENKIK